MPSFSSFLQVAGREYEIMYFDFSFKQQVDHLGRPASMVQGGIYTIEINPPGSEDNTLYEWMANPTKRYTGQVLIKDMHSGMNLKVVRFVAAYCVDMTERFDGTTSTTPLKLLIRISPEKVILDGIKHDNVWPNPTDGDGVTVERYVRVPYKREVAHRPRRRVVPQRSELVKPDFSKPPEFVICGELRKAGVDDELKPYTSGPPKRTTSEEKVEAETEKKIQFEARIAVIEAARENPSLREAADRFELNDKAVEMAKLSDNIYNLYKRQHYEWQLKVAVIIQKDNEYMGKSGEKRYVEQLRQIQNKIDKYPKVLEPPTGWVIDQMSEPLQEPVFVVYKSSLDLSAAPVLVFRGTDNETAFISDWWTNYKQMRGKETAQYTKSIDLAKQLSVKYKGKLEITGHSKGGGQAAAAAIVSGAKGYTFNAAGVSEGVIARYGNTRDNAEKIGSDDKPRVDNFIFPYDFLNALQDNEGGDYTSVGVRPTVLAQDINGESIKNPNLSGMIDYHGMPYLIDSMERQKQDDLKIMAVALGCS